MTEDNLADLTEIDLLKKARRLLLEQWVKDLQSGKLSATDAATLSRLANLNGWVLDETRLPSRLKDKLTANHDPKQIDAHDVIPIRKAVSK